MDEESLAVGVRLRRLQALTRERAHPQLIRAEVEALLREAELSGELAPEHGRGRTERDAGLVERGLARRQALEHEAGGEQHARDPPS